MRSPIRRPAVVPARRAPPVLSRWVRVRVRIRIKARARATARARVRVRLRVRSQ